MRFSELVLQGVRRFCQTHRFPLGPGFTVFVGGPGTGKTTLIDAVRHMLFLDPLEPATRKFACRESETCRAALLIDDIRGARHRLVHDFVQGSIALTRFDPQANRFAPISSSVAEIAQYLGSTLYLPQQDLFSVFYLLQPIPASAAVAAPAAKAPEVGAPPGRRSAPPPKRSLPPSNYGLEGGESRFPGYQGDLAADDGEPLPSDPAAIRAQIGVLERDLAAARDADEAQFRLDGLQKEQFELEQKLKGFQQGEQRVRQLEDQLKAFAALDQVPGDFEKRLREFSERKSRFERDLNRLEEERREWEEKSRAEAPPALAKNRNFLLGMFLGVLCLVLGVAGFFVHPGLRWAALGDLLGFGLAAVAAIRHLDRTMAAERAGARLRLLDGRGEKLKRQFEVETSVVKRSMEVLGAESPAEILEKFAQRNQLRSALEEARREAEAHKNDRDRTTIEARLNELKGEIGSLEARLSAAAGLTMGPQEMERRLQSLRSRLASLEGGAPAQSPPSPPPPPDFSPGPDTYLDGSPAEPDFAPAPDSGPDPFQTLVRLARDLFLVDAERLHQMLSPRAGQYVAALTQKAQTRLIITAQGTVEVAFMNGPAGPAARLPDAERSLVDLGLRLAAVELASPRQPVPMLLDDPFVHHPPERLELLGRMLAGLGRHTQVVLFTSQADFARHASASFEI
jgi:hypothetical protein